MCQFQVDSTHYSVAYFDCVTAFEVYNISELSVKGKLKPDVYLQQLSTQLCIVYDPPPPPALSRSSEILHFHCSDVL